MTFREALIFGKEFLASPRIETPLLDATVLLSEAAKIPKEKIYASLPDPLDGKTEELYRSFLHRRLEGYPVSYIRRKKEFYSLTFYVDERVLVPRPDTEIIVDAALEVIAAKQGTDPVTVLDLGTGSGCIALTLHRECRSRGLDARISASDVSPSAEEVFMINAKRLASEPVPFIRSDLFSAIDGCFDVIVSNPPYLTDEEVSVMEAEGWPEPALALKGGENGLDLLDKIVHRSMDFLVRNGYLLLEAHHAQMTRIEGFMGDAGYADIRRLPDLAGRERVIVGRRD
ncbi:MAG: peptide chain release factor N(5)-glutamine methyltransferase [Spirochaetia bacterium]